MGSVPTARRPDLRCGARAPCGERRGFTLIEIIVALAIIGTLAALAIPRLQDAIERARVARAIQDILAIQSDLAYYDAKDSLPASLSEVGWGAKLDPWGRPYRYLRFPPRKGGGRQPPAGARRDRFLVPINSTYDLYSVGKDGVTAVALTAKQSHDDVVRANDGGYVGLGKNY